MMDGDQHPWSHGAGDVSVLSPTSHFDSEKHGTESACREKTCIALSSTPAFHDVQHQPSQSIIQFGLGLRRQAIRGCG
jgi:hypothetical protein